MTIHKTLDVCILVLLCTAILCIGGCTNTQRGPYLSQGLDRPAITSQEVLAAMARVPRHRFVPDEYRNSAYDDRALPIGEGQTISQPYIVALMTQEAGVSQGSKVLEIGTGSGFQAAVLAELGARVYSIEILPSLVAGAQSLLRDLGYNSVVVRQGDGWFGWEVEAPFDAIIVTAAAPEVPMALLQQLANHGRMVIPIEKEGESGEALIVVERRDESYITKNLGAVRFVPLRGAGRGEQ